MRSINSQDMDDMPLLSKLLAQERYIPDIPEYSLYNKAYAYLQKEITPLLAASSFADKIDLLQDVEHIFDHLEFGLQWPELLGKRMIGLMPLGKGKPVESCSWMLREFVTPEVWHYLQFNHNVTSLILPASDFDGILFLNTAWHIDELTKKEYRRATNALWQKDIEIGQLLECFVFGNTKKAYEHLAFTWLPKFRNRRLPLHKLICENLDHLVIFPSEKEDWASSPMFQESVEFCAKKGLPVTIAIENPQQADCIRGLPRMQLDMVTLRSLDELPSFLQQENTPCCHHHYTMHLRKAFYDVEREAFNRKREANGDLKQIKQELSFLSQEGTREQIQQCRTGIEQELNKEEQNLQQLRQALTGLFQQTTQLEEQLTARSGTDRNALRLPDAFLMANLAREYLETQHWPEAKDLINILEQAHFPYAYILSMLAQKYSNSKVSIEGLKSLKQQGDNEFVRHAKIALLPELGFSEQDAMKIARDIRELDAPAEQYYRGVFAEQTKDYSKAACLYEQAYRQGFQPAVQGLMRLVRDVKSMPLEHAANMLLPEACLLYGKKLLQDKRYAKANIYLKIAAGNGEIEAINILARNLWERINRHYYKGISEKEMKAKLMNCRKLYELLGTQYPNDESIPETLGFIYLRIGDEERALTTWLHCHTAEARYQCGRLYQYNSGAFPQDLDKAAKFFSEASELGHRKAGEEYQKVRSWQKKKEAQAKSSWTYQSTSDYSTRTESTRRSDDGFCFITTAVCRALDKGDDCEELMAMRRFRDNMQARDPLLQEMICEYYRIAPEIVERIQASGQGDDVYQEIWTDDLCPILQYLQHHAYRQATLGYIAMVERLSRQYDVPFQSGIEQNIATYRQRK